MKHRDQQSLFGEQGRAGYAKDALARPLQHPRFNSAVDSSIVHSGRIQLPASKKPMLISAQISDDLVVVHREIVSDDEPRR